jgi:Family of unknown function (DUF6049)
MRPAPRRSTVALILVLAGALAPLSGALTPQVAAAAGPTSPIRVELSTLYPVAPQPGDTLVLTGTLRNVSSEPIGGLQLQLCLGSAIGARSTLDDYASNPQGTLPDLIPVTLPVSAADPTLAPGGSEHFRLSVAVAALGLPQTWEVRELGVQVTGTGDVTSTTVGQLRTFLPWAPRSAIGQGTPTRLAWVWPLIDRPHRGASGVWFNDSLAPEVSSGGRLAGLLNAGTAAQDQRPLGRHHPRTHDVPVTWAIDPMLLDEVAAMSSGYRVATTGGTTAGTGSGAAKQWLAQLRSTVAHTDASVMATPYADPDVVAAVHAGFTTAIGLATATGRADLLRSLGQVQSLTFGWPDDGLADQRTVNALLAAGDTALVLSDTAMPVSGGPPSVTPSARTLLTTNDGVVPVLLSDAGLDADVDGGVHSPNGSRLSLQQFLAETLMIQAEQPSTRRDLVVTPDRRWDPSPGYAAALLADTGRVPWIQPVGLGTVLDSPPYTKVTRDPLTYPGVARRAELSPAYLARVASVRAQIADFNAILPQSTPIIRDYTAAEWQALSSAWRTQPVQADRQLAALSASVRAQMSQVRIASHRNSYVTLTSHGGKVPVTISNNLATPVRVTVQLEANQRLSLTRNGRVTQVVAPHQQVVVDVHAAAKTSGVFPVTAQLLTPKGRAYGQPVQLFVRSTVYGTITLVITGAATAALLVAVAIRLIRRALAARHASAPAVT